MKPRSEERGFTLVEILIVVAILVILLMLVLVNMRSQMAKARDARRKADLRKIQKAYEEYYNDKKCFPVVTVLSDSGNTDLLPYVKPVPRDPSTRTAYLYVPGTPTLCDGYRLCAKLEVKADPDIKRIGCDPVAGCGWAEGYNYCVSTGMSVVAGPGEVGTGGQEPEEQLSATPSPTPEPGQWACTPGGACDTYADPVSAGCPVTYKAMGCVYGGVFQCNDPANRCTEY